MFIFFFKFLRKIKQILIFFCLFFISKLSQSYLFKYKNTYLRKLGIKMVPHNFEFIDAQKSYFLSLTFMQNTMFQFVVESTRIKKLKDFFVFKVLRLLRIRKFTEDIITFSKFEYQRLWLFSAITVNARSFYKEMLYLNSTRTTNLLSFFFFKHISTLYLILFFSVFVVSFVFLLQFFFKQQFFPVQDFVEEVQYNLGSEFFTKMVVDLNLFSMRRGPIKCDLSKSIFFHDVNFSKLFQEGIIKPFRVTHIDEYISDNTSELIYPFVKSAIKYKNIADLGLWRTKEYHPLSLNMSEERKVLRQSQGFFGKANFLKDSLEDFRDNYHVQSFLDTIKERSSTVNLKYEFVQDVDLQNSYLAGRAQEKISLIGQFYQRFWRDYKFFLLKENYFKCVLNLYDFIFKTQSNFEEYVDAYEFNVFFDLYLKKQKYRINSYFSSFDFLLWFPVGAHTQSILNLYLESMQMKVNNVFISSCVSNFSQFGPKKDDFIDKFVEFSLQNRVEMCYELPDALLMSEFTEKSNKYAQKSSEAFKRFVLNEFRDYDKPKGKRRDRVFYDVSSFNFKTILYPKGKPGKDIYMYGIDAIWYVGQAITAYEILIDKIGDLSEFEDIESPRYGIYETLYRNISAFNLGLKLSFGLNVPDSVVNFFYSFLDSYEKKYGEILEEIELITSEDFVSQKLDFFFQEAFTVERDVLAFLNLKVLPFTYKLDFENDFHRADVRYLYKILNKKSLIFLPNNGFECTFERQRTCPRFESSFFGILLELCYLLQLWRFTASKFDNMILWDYQAGFESIFLSGELRTAKQNNLFFRKYLKGNLYFLLGDDSIFFENYKYTVDPKFSKGRFSTSKSLEKQDVDIRFDDEVAPMNLAIRRINHLILTQNTNEETKILQRFSEYLLRNYSDDFKLKFSSHIKDELFLKDFISLSNWLCKGFWGININNWVVAENKRIPLFQSLFLYTSFFNCDVDVKCYSLFRNHSLKYSNVLKLVYDSLCAKEYVTSFISCVSFKRNLFDFYQMYHQFADVDGKNFDGLPNAAKRWMQLKIYSDSYQTFGENRRVIGGCQFYKTFDNIVEMPLSSSKAVHFHEDWDNSGFLNELLFFTPQNVTVNPL